MSSKAVLSVQMLICVCAFVAVVGDLYSAKPLTSPPNTYEQKMRSLFAVCSQFVRSLFANSTQSSSTARSVRQLFVTTSQTIRDVRDMLVEC